MWLVRIFLLVSLSSVSFLGFAEHLTKDAAIGGGLGGAIGGVWLVLRQAGGPAPLWAARQGLQSAPRLLLRKIDITSTPVRPDQSP